MSPRSSQRKLFAYAAFAALAIQLLPELGLVNQDDAFAVPMTSRSVQGAALTAADTASSGLPFAGIAQEDVASSRTARGAAAATVTIGAKVLNAMGAGAVASVIQAMLSAVGEPIINRVLVKRMKVMDAVRDVSPSMMLDFFKTTLATNFLKFPFFEAINALCAHMPIPPAVRGFVTGFVFTTATLPVTNYRYRKSMQMEVKWGNIYEAYFPTVIRDIAYGIVRNYSTIWLMSMNSAWKTSSPQLLFIVVIMGCLGSAPFNEWRGYLLQSKGQELSFKDFFKPENFVRSTGLGAFKQGLALAVGYWCAPPVKAFVVGLIASIKG
jgi:hypothetical protein